MCKTHGILSNFPRQHVSGLIQHLLSISIIAARGFPRVPDDVDERQIDHPKMRHLAVRGGPANQTQD
jgi:hypothetical protein